VTGNFSMLLWFVGPSAGAQSKPMASHKFYLTTLQRKVWHDTHQTVNIGYTPEAYKKMKLLTKDIYVMIKNKQFENAVSRKKCEGGSTGKTTSSKTDKSKREEERREGDRKGSKGKREERKERK
jgi:hypothetical protein